MRRLALMLAAASLAVPVAVAAPTDQAQARTRHYYGSSRSTRCHASSGRTGTIAGGVGGAGAAAVLGAGPLGVVASGVGGALLGRHIDKRRTTARNRRYGC